jgi:hypothetical protein
MLRSQGLKSQNRSGNHVAECIEEQSVRLATVESKCHFVQVGREMLGADTMPRSHDAALKERERGFDGIGCNHKPVLVPHVFISRMIDCFPFRDLRFGKSGSVEDGFISNDHIYVFADVLLHDFADRLRCAFFHVDEFQFAIAFDDADDYFLLPFAESDAFALLLSAHIGFVDLNGSVQHLMNFRHGETDSVAEIPCGFVADSQRALDLIRAHTLLRLAEQERSEKPFLQGKMAVIEDRARGNAKLIVAALAVEQLLRGGEIDGWHFAARAFNAIRPTEAHQQFAALLIRVKEVYNVNQSHRRSPCSQIESWSHF